MKLALLLPAITLMAAIAANAAGTPKAGDKAPLIQGKDQNGKTVKLAEELKQHAVLLYFYPKDDTPGCTKEACGLRDRMEELTKQGVTVLGVSRDDEASHQKFISKFSLNFRLLADTDGKITEAYGAAMSGRPMSRRVSFLIGRDGVIKHVTDVGQAEVHLSEMKAATAKLSTK